VGGRAGGQAELEPLFRELKGLGEDVAVLLNLDRFDFTPAAETRSAWEQAGCHLAISHRGQKVGGLGYLSGPALGAFKSNALICWLELDLSRLPARAYPDLKMTMPPSFPGSWLDFSILWPAQRGFAALEAILDDFGDELVQGREFVAAYGGKGLEPGQKSYTFRYRIGLGDRTLTREDIEAFRARFLAFLGGRGLGIR
jgi:phenylalanyl-tRNA synthetase beta subunit